MMTKDELKAAIKRAIQLVNLTQAPAPDPKQKAAYEAYGKNQEALAEESSALVDQLATEAISRVVGAFEALDSIAESMAIIAGAPPIVAPQPAPDAAAVKPAPVFDGAAEMAAIADRKTLNPLRTALLAQAAGRLTTDHIREVAVSIKEQKGTDVAKANIVATGVDNLKRLSEREDLWPVFLTRARAILDPENTLAPAAGLTAGPIMAASAAADPATLTAGPQIAASAAADPAQVENVGTTA